MPIFQIGGKSKKDGEIFSPSFLFVIFRALDYIERAIERLKQYHPHKLMRKGEL
jgi:hypothetical protein